MIVPGFRGRTRYALHFYRVLQGLQSGFLVIISIFAALLTVVSLRSLTRISDPLTSPGVLDHLSLLMGVHERTAVVVWELDDWCSNVFVFIYQSQPSDGSFYITKEHRETLLPSLLGDEERTPPNGSLLTLEEKIAELASASKKHLPILHSRGIVFSDTSQHTRFPILIRLSSKAFIHPNKEAVLLSLDSFLRNESTFEYREETSMGLLANEDKRALQWFAINLLRGTFFHSDFSISQTVLILNVREHDAELTFAINSSVIKSFTSFPHVNYRTYKLRAYGHLIQLLTLKFPGLGLYSGRRGMYGLKKELKESLRSPCMNPIVNGTWEIEGSLITVRGLIPPQYEMVKEKDGPFAGKKVNKPVANISKCKSKAVAYLQKVMLPQQHNQTEQFKKVFTALGRVRPIYLEGLFLEKLFEQGLTLPVRGGIIGCRQIMESLKYSCKSPNTEQPFSCTDMIYLITILQELLGLKSLSCSLYSPRNISKGMNGDWPFAAAFYIYQNGL
ncbi:nucleoside-diphosphatase uda-1 [Lepeophtheirus salmonis]|uniref:Ectonucleoside triphosphate diphosphohydrolase 5like [Bombus terrestris] n=1 Tax=Lepeophtheirus salmonis TaxID=72036 RepID=A0A0K2UGH0_LEPSM|nr:uncharacterized protein LOC121122701 [Lepeophtheirus salmonis]